MALFFVEFGIEDGNERGTNSVEMVRSAGKQRAEEVL